MKWNSHKAPLPGEGSEWTPATAASEPGESELNPHQHALRRDNYYHIISANHESRSVTLRSLDGAFHFFKALKQ